MNRQVRVIRSAFSPPGQIIVGTPPVIEGLPEEPVSLILPPETSDEALAQAERMVEEHNRFQRGMDALMRAFATDDKGKST